MKVAICRDDVSFSIAFHTARNAGADEFYWRNGRYHTRTAEEEHSMIPTNKPPVIVGWVQE